MQRYYTNQGTYRHGLIIDRVREVYCLFWDNKKKKHSFVTLASIKEYPKHNFGTLVVFDNEEQEKEFLTYHPDAECLRKHYKHGYFYPCRAWGVDEEKLPFEYRRGRWCWKKPLTVA